MPKPKVTELLEGRRRRALLRKVTEIKWNRSFGNTSLSDITSFYENRMTILRNCNNSLRSNNEQLAKSLAEQKTLAQSWYNDSISLKRQLLEYHERLVVYQLADGGRQEEATTAEVEMKLASIVEPIKAAIKSGIDNAIALVDDLNNIKVLAESFPIHQKGEESYDELPKDPRDMSEYFLHKEETMGVPLINRKTPLSSESIISVPQQQRKLSDILRAERIKAKDTLCNDMSVIEELSDVTEEYSDDEPTQVEEEPHIEVLNIIPEMHTMMQLRRSTRQVKMSTNYRLQLDSSSDSDDDTETDLSRRSSMKSTSSASTISDFENYKRSGSFVSTRSRKTKSNKISKEPKISDFDSLFQCNHSVLEDVSLSDVNSECFNKGIVITPSPFSENAPLDNSDSSMRMLNSTMEFTSSLIGSHATTDSPIEVIQEAICTEKTFTKMEHCNKSSKENLIGKTPYDTTMMDALPSSFHLQVEGSPNLRVSSDDDNMPVISSHRNSHGDQTIKRKMKENNKENSPLINKGIKTRRTLRLAGSISRHIDSPIQSGVTLARASSFKESMCPISSSFEMEVDHNSLHTSKIDSSYIQMNSPDKVRSSKRRRLAAPVSYAEPKLNAKCRQENGKAIFASKGKSQKGGQKS